MGEFREYTAAELKERANAQRDPRWLAWLAVKDEAVNYLLEHDVPEMPDDPWSDEGLERAERAALSYFATSGDLELPENAAIVERFQCYIGEGFIRKFEGRWIGVPEPGEDPPFVPVIQAPFNPEYLVVSGLLRSAVRRNIAGEWRWQWVYRHAAKDYARWVKAFRPPMDEWLRMG